ncbi:MAG: aspartyl protease [Fimbriimonadales bacterium]
MGLTHKLLMVKETRRAKKSREVEFLIDSGAVHSVVPIKVLEALGIEAYKTLKFVLADGTIIERQVGDAYFEYNGEGGAAPVVFGEVGDEPLLGATTLESLGLVLNPFKRELYPMRLTLARTDFSG